MLCGFVHTVRSRAHSSSLRTEAPSVLPFFWTPSQLFSSCRIATTTFCRHTFLVPLRDSDQRSFLLPFGQLLPIGVRRVVPSALMMMGPRSSKDSVSPRRNCCCCCWWWSCENVAASCSGGKGRSKSSAEALASPPTCAAPAMPRSRRTDPKSGRRIGG